MSVLFSIAEDFELTEIDLGTIQLLPGQRSSSPVGTRDADPPMGIDSMQQTVPAIPHRDWMCAGLCDYAAVLRYRCQRSFIAARYPSTLRLRPSDPQHGGNICQEAQCAIRALRNAASGHASAKFSWLICRFPHLCKHLINVRLTRFMHQTLTRSHSLFTTSSPHLKAGWKRCTQPF